ncbi:Rna polymerase ispecific transcription initiation factor, partial [Globisporangium splendens]
MEGNQNDHESTRHEEAALPAYSITRVALKLDSICPAQRGGATLTQVENGEIYVIGGANREATCFHDVHIFDFDSRTWTLLPSSRDDFPPRSGHSAVAVGSSIYVFGGLNTMDCEVYNDGHVFNTQTRKWSKMEVTGDPAPSPRNAHAAILLPHDPRIEDTATHRRILMFGGSSPDEGAFNDVYLLHIPLDTDENECVLRWEKVECSGEIPEPRELHCAALVSPTSVCFSGGRNGDGNICTDMAILDVTTWEWQLILICEWNCCSHVAAQLNGSLVSFGGFDGRAIRDDCWVYDDDHESWLRASVNTSQPDTKCKESQADCPETLPASSVSALERFGHAGCSIILPSAGTGKVDTQALLIFGGMNASSDLNDLVLIAPEVQK